MSVCFLDASTSAVCSPISPGSQRLKSLYEHQHQETPGLVDERAKYTARQPAAREAQNLVSAFPGVHEAT